MHHTSPPVTPSALAVPNTLPATASSFANSAGSRASGAVINAVSRARSEPIGHGSCSRGKSRASRATRRWPSLLGVGDQHLDDVLDGDGVVVGMPAIEIGDHGDGGVANLRLARELGLRHVGHADDRVAMPLVGEAFRQGGELRARDADVRCRRGRSGGGLRPRLRPRGGCAGGDTGCAIETCATQPVPKNELSRLWVRSTNWSISTKVPGGSLLLERAAGGERDEVGHARALERIDIGAVVDVGRRQPVAGVVARQKHDRQTGDVTRAAMAPKGRPTGSRSLPLAYSKGPAGRRCRSRRWMPRTDWVMRVFFAPAALRACI